MTPQLRGELVQFWLDEGALPDANTAWTRTEEVVCIARDPNEAIASVNTVYLAPLQQDRLWESAAFTNDDVATVLEDVARPVFCPNAPERRSCVPDSSQAINSGCASAKSSK